LHADLASRVRRSSRSVLLLACALVPACAATANAPTAPTASESPSKKDDARAVAAAHDKVAIARLQLGIAEKNAATSRMRKEKELELARSELEQFEANDAPNRLAKAKLDLQRRRDALTEQKEELAQLEMMYEHEDLADKTREIVLQRGRRRVERAQDELAIEESESTALEAKTLPRERAKLVLEIEVKKQELDTTQSETEVTMLEKRLALRTAEGEAETAEAKAKP
jgi:hypothetical protein